MTIKDLFRVIIKILGVLLLYDFIASFLSIFYFLFYDDLFSFTTTLVLGGWLIPGVISAICLFKTDWLINVLYLKIGFKSDTISIGTISYKSLLKLVIQSLGVVLIVYNLPYALFYFLSTFVKSINDSGTTAFDGLMNAMIRLTNNTGELLLSFIFIVIGYLFLRNANQLVKWIDKSEKGALNKDEDLIDKI